MNLGSIRYSLLIILLTNGLTIPILANTEIENIEKDGVATKIPAKLASGIEVKTTESGENLYQLQGRKVVRHHILDIENPDIQSNGFMVTGDVKTANFAEAQSGYLEMWTHLPEKPGGKEIAASFFSRTLVEEGPMGKLTSRDTEFRKFMLPAILGEDLRRPLKLSIFVVLPGKNESEEIAIRNLTLTDDAAGLGLNRQVMASFGRWLLYGVGIATGVLVTFGLFVLRKRKIKAELSRIKEFDSIG